MLPAFVSEGILNAVVKKYYAETGAEAMLPMDHVIHSKLRPHG